MFELKHNIKMLINKNYRQAYEDAIILKDYVNPLYKIIGEFDFAKGYEINNIEEKKKYFKELADKIMKFSLDNNLKVSEIRFLLDVIAGDLSFILSMFKTIIDKDFRNNLDFVMFNNSYEDLHIGDIDKVLKENKFDNK